MEDNFPRAYSPYLSNRFKGLKSNLNQLSSQTIQFYLFLWLLFKAEALYTLLMCWVCDIITTNSIYFTTYHYLPYIWLLKPLMCLINDRFNEYGDINRRSTGFTVRGYKINIKVLFLIVSELLLMVTSLVVYWNHYFGLFNTKSNSFALVIFLIALVNTSAYAEYLFCKYVRGKAEGEYIKYVSLRLISSALYGISTVFCLMAPLLLSSTRFSYVKNVDMIFPFFVHLNGIFLFWMIYQGVYIPGNVAEPISLLIHDGVKNDQNSPTTESLDMFVNDESQKFSFECILALLLLLLMTMKAKNEINNSKYNTDLLKNYIILLFTQIVKIIVSIFIWAYLDFEKLVHISMGIFCFTLILLHPMHSIMRLLIVKLELRETLVTFSATVVSSAVHQILLTYSFLICLLSIIKGYESTIMSLPQFIIHLSFVSFERYITNNSNLGLAYNFIAMSAHSYCFCILFDINQKNILQRYKNLRSKLTRNTDKSIGHDTKWDDTYSHNSVSTSSNAEPKSPWELQSDISDDSEAL